MHFSPPSPPSRITLANADFALARGKSEEALAMLRDVDEDNRYYIQAKEKMASIYLNIRFDYLILRQQLIGDSGKSSLCPCVCMQEEQEEVHCLL